MSTRAELVEAVKPTLVTTPDDPIAKTVTQQGLSIFDVLDRQQDQFVAAMGDMAGARRMVRVITSEIRRNPKLGECTVTSLLGSGMLSAQLRLEPGPMEQCYLIPRWNGKLKALEVNWQLGYKGMVELAIRSGGVATIHASDVCENDRWLNILGYEPRFEHEPPTFGARGDVVGYYSLTRLADGSYRPPMTIDLDEVERTKQMSDSWKNAETKQSNKPWTGKQDSAWHLHERAMALKTCMRREWAWLPKSSLEVGDAMSADESVVDVPNADSVGGFDDLTITPARQIEADVDAVSPELETGQEGRIAVQAVPDSAPVEPAAATGGVPVEELIGLAKKAGLIPSNAKAATAAKALLPIGVDAGVGEYGDAETLATMEGEQVAAWLRNKIDEGGAK